MNRIFVTVAAAGLSLVTLTVPNIAEAAPCTADEYDVAEYHANRYAAQIANRDNGERDLRADLVHCNVIRLADELEIQLQVMWRGTLSGDRYWVTGELTMDTNGSNVRWSELSSSNSVEE